MAQTAKSRSGTRKQAAPGRSSGTSRRRSSTGAAGTRGPGSGTSPTGRKKGGTGASNRTRAGSSGTKSARRASALERARIERDQREREIRMDIALVVVLVIILFFYLALLGFCGSVGTVLAEILFGFFGIGSWLVPAWLACACISLILQNRAGAFTIRLAPAAVMILIAQTGGHLALHARNVLSLETPFRPAAAFHLCAQHRAGGGITGGALAWGLYRLFGMVGSILFCGAFFLIALILLLQRSPAGAMRSWRQNRRDAGIPGLSERRALYRQRRRREREEAEEARLEREADRILEREDRIAAKEAGRPSAKSGIRSGGKGRLDLEGTRLRGGRGVTAASPGQGPDGRQRRHRTDREPAVRRDIHEIVLLPGEEDLLTVPSGSRGRVSEGTGLPPAAAASPPDPEGTTYRRADRFTGDRGIPAEEPSSVLPGRFTTYAEDHAEEVPGMGPDAAHGRIGEEASGFVANGTGRAAEGPADSPLAEDTAGIAAADQGRDAFSAAGNRAVALPGKDPGAGAGPESGKSGRGPGSGKSGRRPGSGGSGADQAPGGRADRCSLSFSADPAAESAADPGPGMGTDPGRTRQDRPTEAELSKIAVHREDSAGPHPVGVGNRISGPRRGSYVPPTFSLLERGSGERSEESARELRETAHRLQETLRTFGVQVTITDISQGPSVTRYELKPDQGVKVSRIVNLQDDIKLRLAATDIRIEAPIPGKSAIGIEVPNKFETTVHLRELLESRDFRRFDGKLPFTVGKDIGGKTVIADIARMPHLLIAGATGSGKSVCINTIILSILYRTSPDKVKLLMIDPKVVELSVYKGIPHLIIPVVTDARKASAALNWAVAEMEKRYRLFAAAGVRDLNGFNALASTYRKDDGDLQYEPLPRLVVIVDELADLMMVSKSEVEGAICRLAQLARAAGIHLIIATQRPSVDVITGLIKANMPSRIAFAVSSQVDSRTILDMAGAEKLIGRGDMLFYPQNYQKPARIQGAFVSDEEVTKVVDYIRSHNEAGGDMRDREIDRQIDDIAVNGLPDPDAPDVKASPSRDEYFVEAGRFIIEKNKASIGLLQRVFKIGFNRAARIMDQLAEAGVVSEESSTRARQVLMSLPEFEAWLENET